MLYMYKLIMFNKYKQIMLYKHKLIRPYDYKPKLYFVRTYEIAGPHAGRRVRLNPGSRSWSAMLRSSGPEFVGATFLVLPGRRL